MITICIVHTLRDTHHTVALYLIIGNEENSIDRINLYNLPATEGTGHIGLSTGGCIPN